MKKAPFNISIDSDYKELWRYNLAFIGEVAVAGKRVDVVRHLDEVASVGDNLKVAPQGYNPNRNVEIESAEGESLTLYIYVIPHTLPRENTTRDIAPLNMSLIVEHGTTQVLKRWVEINPWSGENVEINIKGD